MNRLLRGLKRLWINLHAVVRYADARTAAVYALYVGTSVGEILRTGELLAADGKMEGRRSRFRPLEGGEIVLDGNFNMARELYCRRVYFYVPGFEIAPSDTVVDLGANVGIYTTMAAVFGYRVVAIEAQSAFLPLIERNLDLNGVRHKAELVHALVGAGTGILSRPEARAAASHWVEPPQSLSFEEVMQACGPGDVDLLKIDIEGSEFSLFSGDLSSLARVRRIVMEVHQPHGDVVELARVLEAADFSVVATYQDGKRVESPADLVGEAQEGYFFAIR